jgi:hypothetical protein
MAGAADYPVTFGYKAQDGKYYGPNGSVGFYHRGNDRACPSGTPIVIGGVTIGQTGATGIVSGPHLHTQACTANSSYADDFDPGPYEFKPGTVIVAGGHSQFGNRIVIRVGGADITYAHLSKINVQVGQEVGNVSSSQTPADETTIKLEFNNGLFRDATPADVQGLLGQEHSDLLGKNALGAQSRKLLGNDVSPQNMEQKMKDKYGATGQYEQVTVYRKVS